MRFLLLLVFVLGCAGNIVEYPEEKEYDRDELIEALKGENFQQKNVAREQLKKIKPAQRLVILEELLKAPDASTRMLAVSELTELPLESVKHILGRVANDDPDEEVREFAFMALTPDE